MNTSELYEILKDSNIDYARSELAPDVWDTTDEGSYILKPDVENFILDYIDTYTDVDLKSITSEIHVVGSVGTNTYTDDVDVDVHMVVDKEKANMTEEQLLKLQSDVRHWVKDHQMFIGAHPLELYIQLEPAQETFGDACYDLLNKKWCKGPKIVDIEYNPYEVYAGVLDKVRELARLADINIGELKRSVIDYERLLSAVEQFPKDIAVKFEHYLQEMLEKVESDIRDLLGNKESWHEIRQSASKFEDPEDFLDDMKSKGFQEANAIFKFLDRYGYMKLINRLKAILDKPEGISKQDIFQIQDLIGGIR